MIEGDATPVTETAKVEAPDPFDIGVTTYGSVASILKHGLDKAFARETTSELPVHHGNIRGAGYYH